MLTKRIRCSTLVYSWASDVAEQAMSLLSSRLEKTGREQYEGCTVFDVALRHSIRKELEMLVLSFYFLSERSPLAKGFITVERTSLPN